MAALEDEGSDILRKARSGRGLTSDDLARESGVSHSDVAAMESGGDAPDEAWTAVARLLGLASAPLLDIVHARWSPWPTVPDVAERVTTVRSYLGGYEVRCYLISDARGGPAILFDCGVDPDAVVVALDERGADLSAILITHGHGDHVGALDRIVSRRPPEVLAVPAPGVAAAPWRCGAWSVQRIDTPGHTADSVSYIVADAGGRPWAVFVGDLLFAGSVGGAGYHYGRLLESIRERILVLPDDVVLFPGHGPPTTVGEEKVHNPFLASA